MTEKYSKKEIEKRKKLEAYVNRMVKTVPNKIAHAIRAHAMEKVDSRKNLSVNNRVVDDEALRAIYDATIEMFGEYYKVVGQNPQMSYNPEQLRSNLKPREIDQATYDSMDTKQVERLRDVVYKFKDNNSLTLREVGVNGVKTVMRWAKQSKIDAERANEHRGGWIEDFKGSEIPMGDIPMTFKDDVYGDENIKNYEQAKAFAVQQAKVGQNDSYFDMTMDQYKLNYIQAAIKGGFNANEVSQIKDLMDQYSGIDFFKLTSTRSFMQIAFLYGTSDNSRAADKIVSELKKYK